MSDVAKVAVIALDNGIDKLLDYAIPESLWGKVKPGMRVNIPVRNHPQKGTVITIKSHSSFAKLAEISELLSEEPLVSEDLFNLATWMARYYCAPLRKILKIILPPSIRANKNSKTQLFVTSNLSPNALVSLCEELRRAHPAQAAILDILLKYPKGILLSQLLTEAQSSRGPVETLIKKKTLDCKKVEIDRAQLFHADYFQTKSKKLNPSQESALLQIKESLDQTHFETHLLYGVTGSGKTEIYLQAIEHALAQEKGAILLIPEISLTTQTMERLRSRFAEKIAILHHRLSEGERHDSWQQIRQGTVRIVVGARSALFSPVKNLGLIIVDEEHESSYKQSEEAPCYHARDVAVMRGKLLKATVVLGSATPSIESYHNALTGKYRLSLLGHRADAATMPTTTIVDMRLEFEKAKGYTLFSDPLLKAIEKRIRSGEQMILFLNRRGYHTAQLCRSCAHVIQCPHCDISLTFHLGENLLACHLCDYRLTPPRACPSCHAAEGLKFRGVGTEQVERALHAIFPEVRTLRLDADTTRHKGSHDLLFKQFRSGKADVLIGTQMIAKGLHFPSVTLVGVLNADSSLNIPDFRAAEQTFQLLTQVSGRSGRGALAGEVIIQTHLTDNPTIRLAQAQDFQGFYQQEISVREAFDYPPFSHFVKLTFSGESTDKVQQAAQELRAALISQLPAAYTIHPIAPSGHAKIKNNYRFQFLVRGTKTGPITAALEEICKNLAWEREVKLSIDVDPLSTFF